MVACRAMQRGRHWPQSPEMSFWSHPATDSLRDLRHVLIPLRTFHLHSDNLYGPSELGDSRPVMTNGNPCHMWLLKFKLMK